MTGAARESRVEVERSDVKHVAGRDINISVTLQLRGADLRAVLVLLGQHLPSLAGQKEARQQGVQRRA
jgi:hypothetical protein